MKRMIRWTTMYPKKTLLVILGLTTIMMLPILQLEGETSLESFFPDYPEVQTMDNILSDFGDVEAVVIIVRGKNVMTPEYFREVADITERIWKDEFVRSSLIEPKDESISSLPAILALYRLSSKMNFDLSMERLLDAMRSFESEDDILKTFESFMKNPGVPRVMKDYTLGFLPEDFDPETMESDAMVIHIALDGSLPREELERAELRIEEMVRKIDSSALTYGFRLLNYYYIKTEEKLFPAFFVALVLILLLMILNFRRTSDVVISLLTLFVATGWTFGLAGILGWKVDLMIGMIPILIFGLGIDFSFHVLMSYKENLLHFGDPRESMYRVLTTVGTALLLAMVTTVVGFSSNGISSISSMRHFGLLAAFSIFSVFVLNLTLVPALRESLDMGKAQISGMLGRREKDEKIESSIVRVLTNLTRRRIFVTVVAVMLSGVALLGWIFSSGMKASYDPTGELSRKFAVTRAFEILNNRFDIGTESVFIRVDGDLTSPQLWKDVQDAVDRMGDDRYVVVRRGKPYVEWIMNIAPFLATEDFRVALAYTAVDRDRDEKIDEGISNKKLRFFLNAVYGTPMGKYYIHRNEEGKFESLLIRVVTKTTMGYHGKALLNELKEDFEGVRADVNITGMPIIWAKGLDDMRDSMTNSIFLCLSFAVLILPIVFGVSHGSPMLGLLTALPPLLVIGWLFASMKLLNIPLNMLTAMVGAIIVGIGIDYPIHMANRWALERKAGKSPEDCHAVSLSSTGKEVLYSALTTLIAFGVFILIPIPVIVQFSITVILGLIYSLMGAVIILPILLRLFWHKG